MNTPEVQGPFETQTDAENAIREREADLAQETGIQLMVAAATAATCEAKFPITVDAAAKALEIHEASARAWLMTFDPVAALVLAKPDCVSAGMFELLAYLKDCSKKSPEVFEQAVVNVHKRMGTMFPMLAAEIRGDAPQMSRLVQMGQNDGFIGQPVTDPADAEPIEPVEMHDPNEPGFQLMQLHVTGRHNLSLSKSLPERALPKLLDFLDTL